MSVSRLTALDSSFLTVESPVAHMHVGWAAAFDPPEHGPPPSFEQLRHHVAGRLCRAPRYRQRLHTAPLGLGGRLWADDPGFDVARHVLRSAEPDLLALAGDVLSRPLDRRRPLWELHIAPELEDGRIGIVGKAHHCMVDGIAAVEMASLLLDATPEPPAPDPDGWDPSPPAGSELAASAIAGSLGAIAGLARTGIGAVRRPQRAAGLALRAAVAAGDALRPAPPSVFAAPGSGVRRLAGSACEIEPLQEARRTLRISLNDLVLAAVAGGLRAFFMQRGEDPVALKAMVPVSLRADGAAGDLGNQISFIFIDLPCDEPMRLRRVERIHLQTRMRKQAGEPEGAGALLDSLGVLPRPFQAIAARLVASPRTFNLVVSNIPGPQMPLWMLGCRLSEAYPVVPFADRHGLSIGFTTLSGDACFGVYSDGETVPEADALADLIAEEVDGLVAMAREREFDQV